MLNGLPSTAVKALSGAAGVFGLAAGANTVLLVAESVRRTVAYGFQQAGLFQDKDSPSFHKYGLGFLVPHSHIKDATTLGIVFVKNVAAATAALFVLNKFAPSVVANANWLVGKVSPMQFGANNPLNLFV